MRRASLALPLLLLPLLGCEVERPIAYPGIRIIYPEADEAPVVTLDEEVCAPETPYRIDVAVDVDDFTLVPAGGEVQPDEGHWHLLVEGRTGYLSSSDPVAHLCLDSLPIGTGTVLVLTADLRDAAHNAMTECDPCSSTVEIPLGD